MIKHNDQERALFEAAILKLWPSAAVRFVRDALPRKDPSFGEYVDARLQSAWIGWQARAQLPTTGVASDAVRRAAAEMDRLGYGHHESHAASILTAAAPHPVSGEQKAVTEGWAERCAALESRLEGLGIIEPLPEEPPK